jgi:hypothetical protein
MGFMSHSPFLAFSPFRFSIQRLSGSQATMRDARVTQRARLAMLVVARFTAAHRDRFVTL